MPVPRLGRPRPRLTRLAWRRDDAEGRPRAPAATPRAARPAAKEHRRGGGPRRRYNRRVASPIGACARGISTRSGTPLSPATVDVSAVRYAEDDHLMRFVEHPVEDAVGAPTSRPDTDEVVTKWLANGPRLDNERSGEKVDDGCRNCFGESVGDGPPSRWGEDELVVTFARQAHPPRRRTASTPRTTSPRA